MNKGTAKAAEGLIFVRMLSLQLYHSKWHGHLARVDSSARADATHETKKTRNASENLTFEPLLSFQLYLYP